MSERKSNYSDHEHRSISPALDRFKSDITTLTNAISLDMAMQKYLRDEFGISETEADAMHRRMQETGAISEASELDEEQAELKNEYRIALFTDIRPLYMSHHTTDDYDEWLLQIMGVMLSDKSRHDIDICLRTNGRNATECEQGRCPIRVIEEEVARIHMSPDFQSFEYITDEHKMHRQAEILLTHAVSYGVIPDEYSHSLEKHYERQCNEYFGVQR